jgi:hypothetical protein
VRVQGLFVPSVTDANDMVDITKRKLEQLVGQYASCVREAEQAVVCEDSPQTHCSSVQYGLIAQAAKTSMAVYNFDSFANHNVAEDGEKREDGREGRFSVDDEEWDVVDFETVCEISHTCSASIGVGDDNHLVAAIDEFLVFVRKVVGDPSNEESLHWTADTCGFPLLLLGVSDMLGASVRATIPGWG